MHGRCGVAAIVYIPGIHHLSRALLLSSELPDQDLVVRLSHFRIRYDVFEHELVVQPSRGAISFGFWQTCGYRIRITSLCLGVIPREPSAENGFSQTTS
jgi:hypothetical protein